MFYLPVPAPSRTVLTRAYGDKCIWKQPDVHWGGAAQHPLGEIQPGEPLFHVPSLVHPPLSLGDQLLQGTSPQPALLRVILLC